MNIPVVCDLHQMDRLSFGSPLIREPRVVILGGAYAGLSTALNLLRICNGTYSNDVRGSRYDPTAPRGGRGRRGGRHGRGEGLHGSRPERINGASKDAEQRTPTGHFVPRISIIEARDGYYHSVGTPLAHTSRDYIPHPWKSYGDFSELQCENVSIIQGRAAETNLTAKTISYVSTSLHDSGALKVLPFDYLVIATGLRRPWPTVPSAFDKKQYEEDARKYISVLEKSQHGVVVVGGGAVGIEMAAEVKHQHPSINVTLVHSKEQLLSSEPVSPTFRNQVLKLVRQQGVKVSLGKRVSVTEDNVKASTGSPSKRVLLSDGSQLFTDTVIIATSGARPATDFLPRDILDREGYVKVLPTGQISSAIPDSSCIFAVGDVISSPTGIKLASSAIRSGRDVALNLSSLFESQRRALSADEAQSRLMNVTIPGDALKIIIGDTAAAYGGQDYRWGSEVKERIFGNDMALNHGLSALGVSQSGR